MTRLTSDLINALVIAMFALSIIFVVRYTKVAPWWRHLVGRAMVSQDAIYVLLLIPSLLILIFHVRAGAFLSWYRVVSLAVGTGTVAWRIWTVGHVNAQVNDPKAPVGPPPVEQKTELENANDAVCSE